MITPTERKWIDDQLLVNGYKGEQARKFTADCIDTFGRNRKQPRKADFTKVNMLEVIPGYQDYLNTLK